MSNGPQVVIKDTPSLLAQTGARFFLDTAIKDVSEKGCCVVALSGGSSPRPMHRLLAKEPYLSGMPWDNTHIFWVDDRFVQYDNPASNYGAAKKDFINSVPIPRSHIHEMPVNISPVKAAAVYQKKLICFFKLNGNTPPVFDLIFLGIGTDGHTASLFPGHPSVKETEKLVICVKGGDPFVDRLSLTFPVLNNARKVVIIVSGGKKAGILKHILGQGSPDIPARMVQPEKGELIWLIDREAASML